jgi:hypothetical protein
MMGWKEHTETCRHPGARHFVRCRRMHVRWVESFEAWMEHCEQELKTSDLEVFDAPEGSCIFVYARGDALSVSASSK